MAKIKHNNFLETVNDIFTDAIDNGVLHLYAEENDSPGRTITVNGRELFHFGTTGYLGLEQDERLKEAAIAAIQRYGTQFPLSKSYISHPLYRELEEHIGEMYRNPIIITKNSTLGHIGTIPTAVDDGDTIILDHQVHWSVQNAAKVLKTRSVPIEMIRHNNLEMLEDKIRAFSPKRKRIWYMADGIYSMYGDYAPVKELLGLTQKYSQLHIYFDDVHGMSWTGRHGTGHVMQELGELTDQMLLFGTLSKTFGASGAVLVCPDKQMHKKIKTFGGPLTFSAQLEPASVAAATTSAKIHLSPEIYALQNELRERTQYFNALLKDTELPLIDKNDSPVFYIGTGMPMTGYNFVNRMMRSGFFVNLGIFPAVPVKNTGVRITISRHNGFEEIGALVEAMAHHYPRALEDTHTNLGRVCQVFGLPIKQKKGDSTIGGMSVWEGNSIEAVDKGIWDAFFQGKGTYDWEGLHFLESVFSDNPKIEHNWDFKYLIIKDKEGEVVLATFFTVALWKDDMLSKPEISVALEKKRKENAYYLTSRVLGMGSLFTEGEHLYWDKNHEMAKRALDAMVRTMEKWELGTTSKMAVLRDFSENDGVDAHFQERGFIKLRMPDSCHIELPKNSSIEGYVAKLSSRNRRHYRKEILTISPLLDIQVKEHCNAAELVQVERLCENVRRNNMGLNTFSFPQKLFRAMSGHPNWEFILICPKAEPMKVIGTMFCYKNRGITYVPAFVGMDYAYVKSHHIYRQLLFQTIKRAIALQFKRIDLGMTAEFEKRKLGAEIIGKYAYLQASDNYAMEVLGMMERQA